VKKQHQSDGGHPRCRHVGDGIGRKAEGARGSADLRTDFGCGETERVGVGCLCDARFQRANAGPRLYLDENRGGRNLLFSEIACVDRRISSPLDGGFSQTIGGFICKP
jgi:hypothetical protein